MYLLDTNTLIYFFNGMGNVAALIRTELENLGTPPGPHDTLIAGTALRSNATLVTHNTKEFNRIKGVEPGRLILNTNST